MAIFYSSVNVLTIIAIFQGSLLVPSLPAVMILKEMARLPAEPVGPQAPLVAAARVEQEIGKPISAAVDAVEWGVALW